MIRVLSSVGLALPAGLRAGSFAAWRSRRIETDAPGVSIVIEPEPPRSTASASGRKQPCGMDWPCPKASGGRFTMRTSASISVLAAALAAAFVALSPTPAGAWSGGGHIWGAEAAARMYGAGQGGWPPIWPWDYRPCLLPGETTYTPWITSLVSGVPGFPRGLMMSTYEDICRNPRLGIPIMPELNLVREWYYAGEDCIYAIPPDSWIKEPKCDARTIEDRYLWDWLRQGAISEDDRTAATMHHFWFSEEGLHECPNDTYAEENAWETAEDLWVRAINFWNGIPGDPQDPPNLGAAYTTLGYTMHLVQDMGQPAHSNEDLHPGDALSDDDSLEDWMFREYCEALFNAWRDTRPAPQDVGPSFPPPLLKGIGNPPANVPHHWLNDGEIMSTLNEWEYRDEVIADNYFMDPGLIAHYEIPQLFQVMYMMNQVGSFFASDSEDGNTEEPLGWLYKDNEPFYGFPKGSWLYDDEEGKWVLAQKWEGLHGAADNDGCDCDRNGDLSRIFQWSYGAAFNASKFVLELFRKTVDRVPPTSTCWIIGGASPSSTGGWRNQQASVAMPRNGVVDNANPGFRPSGVWMLWGLVDGAWADESDDSGLYWTIKTEGDHLVQLMSTDFMGNVEQTDLHVKLDFTKPSIQVFGMKPVLDISEQRDLTIAWTANDLLSGVASTSARLDGQPVTNGQVVRMSSLGVGAHVLAVTAIDQAGNQATLEYPFQVGDRAGCGNGIKTDREQCDDHNVTDGDGCDSNCTWTRCGNGIATAGEECDGTFFCSPFCTCAAAYTPDPLNRGFCVPVVCGNGSREGLEACDDGNVSNGDGCSSICMVEPGYTCSFFIIHDMCKTTCGDGIKAATEACDDGNLIDGDGCDSNCRVTGCGNGIVAGEEQCEDGDAVDGDGCDSNCTATACGNGVLTAGETCDDGNLISGDGCDSNCTPTACGNGILTADEACDDGNMTSSDGCDWDCSPTVCGADPDNDTRWTATPFGDCGLTSATIDCRGDVDFYSFTAPSTGRYSFATTPSGSARVGLYDTSGNPLDRGLTEVSRALAADEKLLVRVMAADLRSTFGYDLEIARRGSLRRVIPHHHPGGGS
jgi:cysteine-rich repeat protein